MIVPTGRRAVAAPSSSGHHALRSLALREITAAPVDPRLSGARKPSHSGSYIQPFPGQRRPDAEQRGLRILQVHLPRSYVYPGGDVDAG